MQFTAVHPVLPCRDVTRTLEYFVNKLGFTKLFADSPDAPTYAGIRRDNVELHLQWHDDAHFDKEDQVALRFYIADLDALFAEFQQRGAIPDGKTIHETGWGTRQFEFYDPDGNALFFYQDLP